MNYIPIFELPILVVMVVRRAIMLRKQGVKVIVFGATNKTDFLIVPCVALFFYAVCASVFDLPFPEVLKFRFFSAEVFIICAIAICTASLVWFYMTLRAFGKSFRVGIDENTRDRLITTGTFALSRNPIYVAFVAFCIGIFLAYPNITTLVFLVALTALVRRQIIREEQFLKAHYGSEYEEYCERVRRWV
jgi:protein-S-isoprenylcysteine O-methyltransferase Ste14